MIFKLINEDLSMTEKPKSFDKFLTVGLDAVKKAAVVSGMGLLVVTTGSFANHFMANAISNHGHTGIQSLADTVNDITYNYTGHAVTQSDKDFRQNLMQRHMQDRVGGSFVMEKQVSETEHGIIKENLAKAEKLGLFEDDDLFRKEMSLLDSAQKIEGKNTRVFPSDEGINDPSDPSHFNVKNLSQLKTNYERSILEIRDRLNNATQANEKNKMK